MPELRSIDPETLDSPFTHKLKGQTAGGGGMNPDFELNNGDVRSTLGDPHSEQLLLEINLGLGSNEVFDFEIDDKFARWSGECEG